MCVRGREKKRQPNPRIAICDLVKVDFYQYHAVFIGPARQIVTNDVSLLCLMVSAFAKVSDVPSMALSSAASVCIASGDCSRSRRSQQQAGKQVLPRSWRPSCPSPRSKVPLYEAVLRGIHAGQNRSGGFSRSFPRILARLLWWSCLLWRHAERASHLTRITILTYRSAGLVKTSASGDHYQLLGS